MDHSETRTVTFPALRAGSAAFDWAAVLLSGWMIFGMHLDAWAHRHVALETFFTPWHAVLYSGFGGLALLLGIAFVRGMRQAGSWRRAMPAGYELALAGAGLFAVGGALDMFWHELFGIEVGIEALLSPTHLLLATGGGLLISGPLRAAWQRKGDAPTVPALVSLALLLSLITFFTTFSNPLIESGRVGSSDFFKSLSIAGVLLQTAILMGITLAAAKRWRLPFGSLTLLAVTSTLFAAFVFEQFAMLGVGLAAGLLADGLYAALRPGPRRVLAWRAFAFGMPALFYGCYFAARALMGTLDWSVHLWTGAIFIAGMMGLLLSLLAVPASGAQAEDC